MPITWPIVWITGGLGRIGAQCARFNRLSTIFLVTLCFPLALASPARAQDGADGAGDPVRLMALGDSLTAGYGLAAEDGFTAQLERALADAGYAVEVLNHGVSGDTTAGGVARLDWALADNPDAALVELGANDMLRGVDPAVARDNLATVIARLEEEGVPMLLAGMLAAPNWGPEYQDAFDAIYPDLAARFDVPLYPFFLDGVATEPALNQPDGLHPTAAGVAVIVESILPDVIDLVERARVRMAGADQAPAD